MKISDYPCVPFSAGDVDAEAYATLRGACLEIGFLPAFSHGILLEVAMIEPESEAALAALRRLTHQEVRRFAISEADFDRAVAGLEAAPAREESAAATFPSWPESWDFQRNSAREIASAMVRGAFAAGASDLLLDEQEAWLDVSIKLAGQKETLPPVEKASAASLLKAFKEMAGLPTQATDRWLSGAASVAAGPEERADLRIEVAPTVHGESLAARIQDRNRQLRRMRRPPFADAHQSEVAAACLQQRQGLIVATGPTGQGKTSTLYACLGQLDRSVLNIRTLEDPVEFTVPWITQIPVGHGTGRGYADGLKSLLRQAPDVILLGEIRDQSGAQICAEAVDTGHLVLATLHTRDAVGVVSRLLDLGLTGRQISAVLLLAIGQRLVRRLCAHCRRPVAITPRQARHFAQYGLPAPPTLHLPGRCPRCLGRGESGVVPLFELFPLGRDEDLAEMVGRSSLATFDERYLRARWRERGGSPLVREGLLQVAEGQIAYAEVLKHERNPPE